MMEDHMHIDAIDQRGTKRAAEEDEPPETPKPKKIKVRQRVHESLVVYYH
jgi:DNA mismatch repair protein MLH1